MSSRISNKINKLHHHADLGSHLATLRAWDLATISSQPETTKDVMPARAYVYFSHVVATELEQLVGPMDEAQKAEWRSR